MKVTQFHEEIAKELTLQLIQAKRIREPICQKDDDVNSWNVKLGETVGCIYQAILAKVCESNPQSDEKE